MPNSCLEALTLQAVRKRMLPLIFPMALLAPSAVSVYRDVAADQVGNFGEQLEVVLRERCAAPEFAGGSVMEFLDTLPRCTSPGPAAPTIDAFYAEKMLQDTRLVLLAIVKEDQHTAQMLREVHQEEVDVSRSLDPDEPTLRDRDRSIRDETRGDQEAVDRAINAERGATDADVNESFQSEFDCRGEGDLDFSSFPPSICYQQATRALIHGILQACAGSRDGRLKPRLRPLVEGGVLTRGVVQQIFRHIRTLASMLKYDSTGTVDVMED